MASPVALITGASRGIGRAVAVKLAAEGYSLALVARSGVELAESARLASRPDALQLAVDVTDAEQVRGAVEATVARFGRLDALINVAGVAPVRSVEAMTVDEWRVVIDTNLSAVFYATKFAWAHLKAAAVRSGHAAVVNISSLAARDPFPGFAAYGAAKAGVNLFGLAAAREGQADGIAVHTIAPGAVETAMFRQIATVEQWPAEKTMSAEDVSAVVADCVTGRMRYASGEVIYLHKTL
jgi:NAD(P)-dependent dehydrogenase (short-subunit alcohol dehydrogenase family)